jgi:GNAT superfamily N-acetyltransferase
MRRATSADIPLLLTLMSEFYSEGGYTLDRAHAGEAFAELLADERLGYVWLIDDDMGYLVVTLRFGMEYGGQMACLDDLYVVPHARNRGLATAALLEVRDFCQKAGIRAMTVEVGDTNVPAQAVYRRVGFTEPPGRQLLALSLAHPTHITSVLPVG